MRRISLRRFQQALEQAARVWPALQARYQALNARRYPAAQPYDPRRLLAPLPRAWQWLDGSAFLSHGERMQRVFICRRLPAPTRRR